MDNLLNKCAILMIMELFYVSDFIRVLKIKLLKYLCTKLESIDKVAKIHVQTIRFMCCLNIGFNLTFLNMSPDLLKSLQDHAILYSNNVRKIIY